MSFPRYVASKDSGLLWLGSIPDHWSVGQSRRLFALRNQGALETDKQLTASQEYGVIYQSEFVRREGRRVVQVVTGADILKHVEPGDFVISMRSFQGGIEFCPFRGSISSAYVALAPVKMVHPPFFKYVFKSKPYILALQATSNLVRDGQALRFENFAMVSLPLVPIDEQASIAAFLDREIAKIDALVEEQKRLIELLKEKRQAVISQAVTKGLDPSVPMKESGVEWLKEVPAHWKVTALKRLCVAITDGAHISPETEDGVHPFVSTKDVRDGAIDLEGCLRTSSTSYELMVRSGCKPESGDVLFSKDGTIGRTAVVPVSSDFVVASSLIIIRPKSGELRPKYLDLLCQSSLVASQVEGYVKGAGLPRLSIQNLLKVIGVFPPIAEQDRIVARISSEVLRIELLVGEAQEAVSLLAERRSALISAAVTGKIDVRGLAPQTDVAVA